MEDENILEFGSEDLKHYLVDNSNFAKFEIGKPCKVEIISSEIKPRIANFDGKETQRFDIKVKINDEEKVWSVSKTVLRTIADNWDKSKIFNVIRGEKSYTVIPLE
jgi:hypothetical protein